MPGKKRGGRGRGRQKSRDIELKKELQEYAIVTQRLGDCRYILYCEDKNTRMGHLRGNMRNRVYVREGDYVLVSFRQGYEKYSLIQSKNKLEYCDIIYKYFEKEINYLKSNGHIPNLENMDNGQPTEEDNEFDELINSSSNTDSNLGVPITDKMDIDTDKIDI